MRTLFLVLLLSAGSAGIAGADPLDAFRWMTGNWRSPDGMEESWSEPAGGTMLGTCREVGSGHVEFMLLEEGKLLLYLPRLQKTMRFVLAQQAEQQAVFRREDGPDTLTYQKLADGRLDIRLDKGPDRFHWQLTRAAAP